MSSYEQSKLELALMRQEVRLEKYSECIHDPKKIMIFNYFLEYLKKNPNITYFSISTIKRVSNTSDVDDVLSIVEFFSEILDIEYIYLTYDDELKISKESYFNTILHNTPPIDMLSGLYIEDFNIDNLSFYCTIDMNLLG